MKVDYKQDVPKYIRDIFKLSEQSELIVQSFDDERNDFIDVDSMDHLKAKQRLKVVVITNLPVTIAESQEYIRLESTDQAAHQAD